MQNDHIHTLKLPWATSECGVLWEHQNSPACTKNVRVFKTLMLDHHAEEAEVEWEAQTDKASMIYFPGHTGVKGNPTPKRLTWLASWKI